MVEKGMTKEELFLKLASGDPVAAEHIEVVAQNDEYAGDVLEEYMAAAEALTRWLNKKEVSINACQQYKKVMAERLEELRNRLENGGIVLDKDA